MRQRGRSPGGVNIYIRAMNAFCSWLAEQGHLKEPIRLRQLKNHSKPVQVFSEAEIKRLLANKPKGLSHLRTWTLITLLLDTGCRIDEILSLAKTGVDFDNLLLTVYITNKAAEALFYPQPYDKRDHLVLVHCNVVWLV